MPAWAILVLTTPACTNFAGIATNRFLLGVTEAVVNPGFVLVTSMWYRKAEQPLRLVTYYCMNGFAGIFGGLLGYAIGHITSGLPQWMYVFIIFGSVSFAWGVLFLVFMPDLPSTATRFLSPREAVVAVERVATNRQGIKNQHFKRYQLWQTLRDPKTWILFVMAVAAQIPNAAQSTVSHPRLYPIPLTSTHALSFVSNVFYFDIPLTRSAIKVHVHHPQDLWLHHPADPVHADPRQRHPDRLSPSLGVH